jgi:protein SCO1/2
MKNKFKVTILIIAALIAGSAMLRAEDNPQPVDQTQVGIVEHLGDNVPLDIRLYDEFGKTVLLKDLTGDKPTLLMLVYFRCPGICSPLMNGAQEMLDKIDLEPGKDFNVITVSFDSRENYLLAAQKKKNYFAQFKNRMMSESSWRFLTADSTQIYRLTEAVGFKFMRKDNDFVHSAVITFLSPEGKVTRYLYGIEFNPFDVKMALVEASQGKVGSTVARIVQMCFSYDPQGRKYVMNFTRVIGAVTIFCVGIFAVIMFSRKKIRKSKKNQENK